MARGQEKKRAVHVGKKHGRCSATLFHELRLPQSNPNVYTPSLIFNTPCVISYLQDLPFLHQHCYTHPTASSHGRLPRINLLSWGRMLEELCACGLLPFFFSSM